MDIAKRFLTNWLWIIEQEQTIFEEAWHIMYALATDFMEIGTINNDVNTYIIPFQGLYNMLAQNIRDLEKIFGQSYNDFVDFLARPNTFSTH